MRLVKVVKLHYPPKAQLPKNDVPKIFLLLHFTFKSETNANTKKVSNKIQLICNSYQSILNLFNLSKINLKLFLNNVSC